LEILQEAASEFPTLAAPHREYLNSAFEKADSQSSAWDFEK
jgi:hypothetical protein